jgi:hypothetical protein
MLVLYTRIFGHKVAPSELQISQNPSNSTASELKSEPESSTPFRPQPFIEEIRKVQQTYHLERRFLM